MATKTKIQYVGQFYVYGSEAPQVAEAPKKNTPKTQLPLFSPNRICRIKVDPVAVCSLMLAMVVFVAMVAGALQLQSDWQEFRTAKNYMEQLRAENKALELQYQQTVDLTAVEAAARSMGMVPASEVSTLTITVTVPERIPEPTPWDNVVWFLSGLFA